MAAVLLTFAKPQPLNDTATLGRQHMTLYTRHLYYLLFVYLAAPADFTLDLWNNLEKSGSSFFIAVGEPFAKGAIFVYAFVLACETLLRMELHPAKQEARPHLSWIRFSCIAVLLLFVMQHMNVDIHAQRANTASLSVPAFVIELIAIVVALSGSHLSYYFCEVQGQHHSKESHPISPTTAKSEGAAES